MRKVISFRWYSKGHYQVTLITERLLHLVVKEDIEEKQNDLYATYKILYLKLLDTWRRSQHMLLSKLLLQLIKLILKILIIVLLKRCWEDLNPFYSIYKNINKYTPFQGTSSVSYMKIYVKVWKFHKYL